MNPKVLFIDESGKTGTQRYSSGSWNFHNQPYFALCGLLVPSQNINELSEFVGDLKKKYKIQGEIKSTKSTVRKKSKDIMLDLWDKQKKLGCELYLELVNKKFCTAMMITDYCIFPYYDIDIERYNSPEGTSVRKLLANYTYESITDNLLGEFNDFFDNNSKDVNKLKILCEKLVSETDNEFVIKMINETIDSINSSSALGLSIDNLFPLIDNYKENHSTVAISPHINSFNNILNRIGNLTSLTIIHDKINDLDEAIKNNLKLRNPQNIPNTINFNDSKKNNLLQVADFWCGYIKNSIKDILDKNNNINNITKKIIDTRVNIVSSLEEQSLVFPNNLELKVIFDFYKDFIKHK